MSEYSSYEFKYPPNEQICLNHRKANRIFKGLFKNQNDQIKKCQCCGKAIGSEHVQDQLFYDYNQLSFLGVGIPLYFSFIKSSILLLLILSVIYLSFGALFNLTKSNCKSNPIECKLNIFQTLEIGDTDINFRNFVSIQNYILLTFVVFTIFFFQFLRYKFRKTEKQSDQVNDTPSDYAIIIKRLPQNINISDIQSMIEERRGFLSQQQKDITDNLKVQKIILSFDLRQYVKMKQQYILEFKKLIKSNKYENFKQPLLPTPNRTVSIAIVVFTHQCSKDFFIQRPKFNQRTLSFFFRSLTPLSDYYVKGKRVSIQRAPQPDDIIWQNAHVPIYQSILRKLIFGSVSFVLLIISGYSQYRLALTHTKTQNQTTRDFLHIFSSSLVHFSNMIIKQYMIKSVCWQKLSTQTQKMELLATKICLLQFLNSGFVIAFANVLANGQLFQLDIEFAQKATHIMTLNAIIPILSHFCINYFELFPKIKRFLMHKKILILTQLQANKIYQLPSPKIPNQYAYIIKTLWLTAFYAPFSPIVVPISIAALIVHYLIQKRLFHGSYSAPHMLSSIVNEQIFQLFEYFPLILSFGMFYLYIDFLNYQPKLLPQYWNIPILLSIMFCIINLVSPTKQLNLLIYKRIKEKSPHQPLYQQVQKSFEVTYQMTNPAYKSNRKRLSDSNLFKQLKLFDIIQFNQVSNNNQDQNNKLNTTESNIYSKNIPNNSDIYEKQKKRIKYSDLKLKKQKSYGLNFDNLFNIESNKQKNN